MLSRKFQDQSILTKVWKVRKNSLNGASDYAVMKIAEYGLNYEKILNEIDILRDLDHENIVRYLDSYTFPKGNPCLILEYCDQGSLQNFIVSKLKV